MKHPVKITVIILSMFLITQIFGLVVINAYSPHTKQEVKEVGGTIIVENVTVQPQLPYGMQPPEMKPEISLISIMLSIILATGIILLLRRFGATLLLKIWFFSVIAISIGITLNALLSNYLSIGKSAQMLSILLALPLAASKMFRRNVIVHNITEVMVYPGIAAVFVPILNTATIIVLLFAIAVYDVYAVWHAKFMQKLAKFQIQKLGVFTGFYIPFMKKGDRAKIKRLMGMKLNEKEINRRLRKMKVKISLAILGGGDITFPLIFAGVVLRASGLLPALFIIAASFLSLALLFIVAKKGKFYPAMLFLTPGCIIGWLLSLLI